MTTTKDIVFRGIHPADVQARIAKHARLAVLIADPRETAAATQTEQARILATIRAIADRPDNQWGVFSARHICTRRGNRAAWLVIAPEGSNAVALAVRAWGRLFAMPFVLTNRGVEDTSVNRYGKLNRECRSIVTIYASDSGDDISVADPAAVLANLARSADGKPIDSAIVVRVNARAVLGIVFKLDDLTTA